MLLVVVATLAALCAAAGSEPTYGFPHHECDCQGFSLLDWDEPVCGGDGLVYAAACLAHCQGVDVMGPISTGTPCGGQNFEVAHPQHFIPQEEGFQVSSVVGRHSGRGFKYLGLANQTRQAELHERLETSGRVVPVIDSEKLEKRSEVDLPTKESMEVEVLYTNDGHVYGRRVTFTSTNLSPWALRTATKSKAEPLGRAGRKLKLQPHQVLTVYGDNGEDDRSQVEDTTKSPFKRIGFIDPIGCTGSLISPKHVLTAAHCAFSNEHGAFYPVTFTFSPGRTDGLSPLGTFEVDDVVLKGCFASGQPECDFAVMTLKEPIGEELGYFGVGLDCSSKSVNLHIAGYPSDKPSQTMWTENCGKADVSCTPDPRLVVHTCDVTEGTSGSPLWDDDNNVRGVNTGAVFTTYQHGNIGVYMTPLVHDSIKEWIGED